jgi:hypothetical protein
MLLISGNRNRDLWKSDASAALDCSVLRSCDLLLAHYRVPSRYLIDRQGTVHAADVNADYTIRTEPADTLNQLRSLSAAAADSQDQSTWKENCNPTRCAKEKLSATKQE